MATITGTSGNDNLTGTSGDDTIDGLAGADTMTGGLGNDTYYVDNPGDVVVELSGQGTDIVSTSLAAYTLPTNVEKLIGSSAGGQTLTGNDLQDTIIGGGGDDTIYGGNFSNHDSLANSLQGGGGNDTIYIGTGYGNSVDGGAGVDTLNLSRFPADSKGLGVVAFLYSDGHGNVTTVGTVGSQDTAQGVMAFSNIENVVGTPYKDYIYGYSPDAQHAQVLDGGGGSGDNISQQGGGFDFVGFSTATTGVRVDFTGASGGRWDAYWIGQDESYTLDIRNAVGTVYNDTFLGGSQDNIFVGNGGADYIDGGAGSDTVSFSGFGHAVIVDLSAGQTWDGTSNATLVSIENAIGSAYNDIFVSNGVANHFDGGAGTDTVSYNGSVSGVIVDLPAGGSWDGSVNDSFISIENIVGSAFNDTLAGDGGANVIDGGTGGADLINGGAGSDTVSYASSLTGVIVDLPAGGSWDGRVNDTLISIENVIGSAFNDTLAGDAGNNVLDGGTGGADLINGNGGADTVSYASSLSGVIVDLPAGGSWDGSHNDTLVSIENIIGSAFNDTLAGDAGDNVIDGGIGGADYINGNGGTDTVSYASSLTGVFIDLTAGGSWDGAHNDTLVSIENGIGSAFNDTFNGNSGDNVFTGAGGADTFIFSGTGFGHDTVTDFTPGTDVLKLYSVYTDFNDAMAHATQSGANAVFTSGSSTFTLNNVTLSNLHASDFMFA